MQVQKTIKFKVGELTNNKEKRLNEVLCKSLACLKDILEVSKKEKTTSNKKLHHLVYKDMRDKYELPACVIHQSRNKSVEIMKSWWKNIKRGKKKHKFPEPRALRIRYDNVVFKLIETENKKYPYFASVLCEQRTRIYLPLIVNSDYQKEHIKGIFNRIYKKSCGELVKKGKDFFIHVTISKKVNIPKVDRNFNPIGIDIGINNLACVTVLQKSVKFFSGKRVIWKKKNYGRIKSILQNKRANKKLKQIYGREQRFIDNLIHKVSAYVIGQAKNLKNPVVIMENLRYIRETTKQRKKQRHLHQTWAFRKLQQSISYKANWDEIPIIYVNPEYTSQICPKCFSVNKRNKHSYKCRYCDYELNSDFIGSVNIAKSFFETISFQENSTHKSAEREELLKFNNNPKVCVNFGVSPPKPKGLDI